MHRWLALSAAVIALDLYTKYLVQRAFSLGDHYYVTRFFDIVRYHNEGAAFSFLAGAGGWQRFFFSAVAILASVVILFLLRKHKTERLFCFALALVLGGALGNLYDRLTLGYVVDFLFFHYQSWYWPAFNVADSAITCGVVLLLIDSFKSPEKKTIRGQ
jgi:signal peptidase II